MKGTREDKTPEERDDHRCYRPERLLAAGLTSKMKIQTY
jgi:hypothetical protein